MTAAHPHPTPANDAARRVLDGSTLPGGDLHGQAEAWLRRDDAGAETRDRQEGRRGCATGEQGLLQGPGSGRHGWDQGRQGVSWRPSPGEVGRRSLLGEIFILLVITAIVAPLMAVAA